MFASQLRYIPHRLASKIALNYNAFATKNEHDDINSSLLSFTYNKKF